MADLVRRRPAAGDEAPVLDEMRRENDEDVDPVLDDFEGDLRIVQSNGRPPDIANVFEQSRCRIRMRNFGIGVDCEPRAIEPLEDWQHVDPNGMRPKIRGQVAYMQRPFRILTRSKVRKERYGARCAAQSCCARQSTAGSSSVS